MPQRECRMCLEADTCSPLCQSLSLCDWEKLAAGARRAEMPKGSVLDLLRAAPAPVCIVSAGTFGLQHILSDGRRTLSELFVAGDIIDCRRGLRRFQGDVVALTEAWLWVIRADRFDESRRTSGTVDQAFDARLREQAHILRDHCVDIGKKTPRERIASFMFEQVRRLPEASPSGRIVRIALTHADIGDYLAMQPETVSRSMTALSAGGTISSAQDGVLEILDQIGLRRIANGGVPRRRKTGRESRDTRRSGAADVDELAATLGQ